MKMSSKVYDFLKWFTLLFMPSLAVLVNAIGGTVGITNVDDIVIVINGLTVFLASILGISNMSYNKNKEE